MEKVELLCWLLDGGYINYTEEINTLEGDLYARLREINSARCIDDARAKKLWQSESYPDSLRRFVKYGYMTAYDIETFYVRAVLLGLHNQWEKSDEGR